MLRRSISRSNSSRKLADRAAESSSWHDYLRCCDLPDARTDLLTAVSANLAVDPSPLNFRSGIRQIRRIQIIFAGYPDQRKESVAPRIGQCCAHAMWVGGFADRADRPVRGDPLARGMRQNGAEPDNPGTLVNRGGLHRRDLMLAQSLAHDVEPARERA